MTKHCKLPRACARNRIHEAEALEHHENQPVHAPTPAEEELTRLNLALINTQDPG